MIYCPCCQGAIAHCGEKEASADTNYLLLGPGEDGLGNPIPGENHLTWEALCGRCGFSFRIESDHRPDLCSLAAKTAPDHAKGIPA